MKKNKQQAAPLFTTDADGQQLVHVALANSQHRATLYAEDYERLMDAGWSPHWSYNNTGGRFRYVLINAKSPRNRHRAQTVARLIAAAGKGRRITYADGDRLNLRRENLVAEKGGGIAHTPAEAVRPTRATARPTTALQASSEHAAAYTPRVIDRAALSARVRDMQPASA